MNGSSRAAQASDPWIVTTTDLGVAQGFNGAGNGIVAIDLDRVASLQASPGDLST